MTHIQGHKHSSSMGHLMPANENLSSTPEPSPPSPHHSLAQISPLGLEVRDAVKWEYSPRGHPSRGRRVSLSLPLPRSYMFTVQRTRNTHTCSAPPGHGPNHRAHAAAPTCNVHVSVWSVLRCQGGSWWVGGRDSDPTGGIPAV